MRSRAAKGKGHVRTGPPGALRAEASGSGEVVGGWPQTVLCRQGWPAEQRPRWRGIPRPQRPPRLRCGGLEKRQGFWAAPRCSCPQGILGLGPGGLPAWRTKDGFRMCSKERMDRDGECLGLCWPSLGAASQKVGSFTSGRRILLFEMRKAGAKRALETMLLAASSLHQTRPSPFPLWCHYLSPLGPVPLRL